MAELRLEAREFRDLTRWRWVLTDAAGSFLADHEVRLDPDSWQFEAFADLRYYVSWHAAPDRYHDDQARIVAGVGAWAGAHVLGPHVADALVRAARRAPVTVRVIVPPEARDLLLRPLELTHVHGRPLARQDITLVMRTGSTSAIAPAGDRLRILGLFSLPEGGQPLNLRRERYSLVGLARGITASGKAADVRVLQYGVTRDRLRDVLEEAEGWDVIHISGHGKPGQLLLETAAGAPDLITAGELADMLDLARERVKLVTVSACWSAADATADQRRLLGLPVQEEDRATERTLRDPSPPGALATGLAERLGCAVLAMRFPVDDEFAIAMSQTLYRLLAEKGQPLPRAVGMTLRELRGNEYPALSVAAPALFGETAIGLTLAAPPRQPGEADYAPQLMKMAAFPPQAERFVGRTGVMARASAALAAESGVPAVLLHGMPGGGKTACAVELAYTHEHAFDRLVWYKAPDEGMAIDGALPDFALTLERDLPGFRMSPVLADEERLTAVLPTLTELAERKRVLIVIDNAGSLLTDAGQWRDERWGQVIHALTDHAGLGRLLVTSQRFPARTTRLRAEPVGALPEDEALLLGRELPHLRKLISGKAAGTPPDDARALAREVMNTARGHPKLLELADVQAAGPGRLTELAAAGDQYLSVLGAWTTAVTGTLAPGERDLFWFLCCLEENDRIRSALDSTWAGLRDRLGRRGEPPALDPLLGVITARGLATADARAYTYSVHPALAAAGRARAGTAFQDATDTEAAAFWHDGFRYAAGENDDGTVNARLTVRAGLSAVPYLVRQQRWADAAYMLERAFEQEPSRANAVAALPAAQQIARHDPRLVHVLALVTQALDPAEAETMMRSYMDEAAARGDYASASAVATRLFDLYHDAGRPAQALPLADQMIAHSRQAGLGPWTQLLGEVQRLRTLNRMGQASQVLADVQRLRDHMGTLPGTPGPNETAPVWNVRELLLEAGGYAALQLGRWEDVLAFNAENLTSKRDRHAPAVDIAAARFNDYYPLRRLGHADEALDLLLDCRRAFEDADDIAMLANTLGALGSIESDRRHGDAAIRFLRDALRYTYLAGDVTAIAAGCHNLGNCLSRHASQPAAALASHLTAALISTLTGGGAVDSVNSAAIDLRELGADAAPPTSVADLCRQLGDIPGTDPAGLIAKLSPDPETAEQTLRALVTRARELATLAEREHD